VTKKTSVQLKGVAAHVHTLLELMLPTNMRLKVTSEFCLRGDKPVTPHLLDPWRDEFTPRPNDGAQTSKKPVFGRCLAQRETRR
jgi:hypothetical protein